jgi:hypothetical protein
LLLVDIDVIPVGADLVKVWGVESELFLMIDDQGQMRGTVSSCPKKLFNICKILMLE